MTTLCTSLSANQYTPRDQHPTHAPNLIQRLGWALIANTIFPFIPSPAYRARRIILRAFGATLDPHARIRGGVRISHPWNLTIGRKSSIGEGTVVHNPAPLTIGDRSVVSQYCYLQCVAHDENNPRRPQHPTPLTIGDDVWIATECVVEGTTHIPNGLLVGARSVLTKTNNPNQEIEPWTIATGHPARSRRPRPYQGPKS